ncbi:MAG: hypothetical protein U0641_05795 [Anaerolineae bacterium]
MQQKLVEVVELDEDEVWKNVAFVIDEQGYVCVWLPQPRPVKEVGFIRRQLHSAHFATFIAMSWSKEGWYNLQGYNDEEEWEREHGSQ